MTHPERESAIPQLVVMGVSGSGKSTIGALVARELCIPFVDGDSLHPAANIAKMAAGTPLDDNDRWPWLAIIGRALADAGQQGAGASGTGASGRGAGLVVACSALKRAYRDAIREEAPGAFFIHLDGTREVLERRLEGRRGHFMPKSLLDSQIADLEPLGPDERGQVVDIDGLLADIVHQGIIAATTGASP